MPCRLIPAMHVCKTKTVETVGFCGGGAVLAVGDTTTGQGDGAMIRVDG